jgi:3-oxoacyl-[acyl-carrier-protein] synthase II
LALGCKGYNMTYTNNANSFESAVMDAHLYLNENPNHTILIGGLDEISDQTVQFWERAGFVNSKNPQIPTEINSSTQGEVVTEGTGFYVASIQESENAIGRISAVKTAYQTENPEIFIQEFLSQNSLQLDEIDAVILGNNGDAKYDEIYTNLAESIFAETPQIHYKNLIGEFDTVTSIAVELGLKVLQNQEIPTTLKGNSTEKDAYQTILIYNQRRGKNHSLILLKK